MSEQSLPPDVLLPLVTYITIHTFFGSVLAALILTLIFFSTPQSRRHPVFILNIIACCSRICEAVLSITTLALPMITYPPRQVPKPLYVASNCLELFSGIFVDSILLFRILAFYPFSITPTPKFVAVLALPVLAKCARFGVAVVYIYQFMHTSSSNIQTAAKSIWPNPFVLGFKIVQVIDNSYASGILLYKIHQFRRERNETIKINSSTLVSYLRSLVIIALGNFVFPVAMDIASIIVLVANASFNAAVIVLTCENYISMVGIVFATIWTRRRYWNRHDRIPDHDIQLETYTHTAPFASQGRPRTTIRFGNDNVESVLSVRGKGKKQSIDLGSSHPSITKT